MSTPKPCPFCGHVGLDFREGSTFRWVIAECAGCGAGIGETRIQTLGDGTKEEWMAIAQQDAIDAWNRRAAVQAAQPEAVGDWRSAALTEIAGCFDAAMAEGLLDALANTADARLKDLVERRLMYAHPIAAQAAPTPEPMSAPTAEPDGEPKRCTNCDGTGDVHTIDGQWRGRCSCPAGNYPTTPYPAAPTEAKPAQDAVDAELLDWLESQINEHGAIHLHDGNNPNGHGLGLRPGSLSRTLRDAIRAAISAKKVGAA